MIDELSKMRPVIGKLLNKVTGGEITEFDFYVDYLNHSSPEITVWIGVPDEVKKRYHYKVDEILDKHLEKVYMVFSSLGFPGLTKRSVRYEIL
jgi:hypothetical protein